MASPWEDFAPTTDAAPKPWERYAKPADQDGPIIDSAALSAALPGSRLGPILKAFGQGASEDWKEPLGLSPEATQMLSKAGIFAPSDQDRYSNPFHAMNEILANTILGLGQIAFRTGGSLLRGGQAAVFTALGEGPLARDVAAVPEAFFGSPHPLGIPKRLPEPVKAVERAPNVSRATEAETVRAPEPPEPVPPASPDLNAIWPTFQRLAEERGADYVPISDIIRETGLSKEEVHDILLRGAKEGDVTLSRHAQGRAAVPKEVMDAGIPDPADLEAGPYTIARIKSEALAPPTVDLGAARDLGVVGEERPPITEGTPEEAAKRAVAADQRQDVKTQEAVPNDWQQRFEQFVGKLDTGEDVKQLIRDAAKENDDFPAARQGDISLAHVESVAQAAGVATEEINPSGLGRRLQNDAQVRVAMQLMLQATENVKTAARDVKADGSPESLIKMQQAIMQRDLAVEQVVGLRAEWGRTGNVIQEFLRDVKDQEGLSKFLKDKGRSAGDLRDIANAIDTLDSARAARLLTDLRKPGAFDKFMWYWVNALISGPVTHAKYIVANATFGAYEAGIIAPVAGGVGTVRRALTGSTEGVRPVEAAGALWGLVAGVPDALRGAVTAARTGLQTPLPGETALGIVPKRNKNVFFQQVAPQGKVADIYGIPMKGASAIHSFFNFLGYRASIERQSYRLAVQEGHAGDAFWQRRQALADRPTEAMMNEAIEDGYRLTFIKELGPTGKKFSAAVNATGVGRLVMPFTHIPLNLLKEGTEAAGYGFLQKEVRENLAGKNGAVKQDQAIARVLVGTTVGAWSLNMVGNDRMTGYGPTDAKERAQWLATGHQPYSIRIGDEWVSYNRFGPLGTMLGLHANLAEAIPHLKPDAEELTKAIVMTVHSTGRLLEDEVGMQGLAGIIEAVEDPGRRGTRFISSLAGSMLPWSSALRQVASAMDPEMRETKTVVDGLRYYIPGQRQTLYPKRDWSGSPIANAGYGGDIAGAPGLSAIIQHRAVGTDPVAFEMKALDLHPAPPENRIGGVQLPPGLYDEYQTRAGAFTRTTLEALVQQPGWYDLPAWVRADVFRKTIQATRQAAGAATQAAHPQIIQQGISNRLAVINGVKPTKLKDPD